MTTKHFLSFASLFLILLLPAQNLSMDFEATKAYPFGRINPDAPEQLKDFEPLIGMCDCTSESRKPDKTWAKPVAMTWKWKYIMNGMAVQDETLKQDGRHSGSIRQYSQDSARWYVHYYSSAAVSTRLSTWEGNKKDGAIVLYREQKAPNGMDGYYRLTFSNITDKGFNWIGEWVNKDESFSYATWKIACVKRED